MATIENSNWLSTLILGPKPKVKATAGIKNFSAKAYKESGGANSHLVYIYRTYKEPAKKRA